MYVLFVKYFIKLFNQIDVMQVFQLIEVNFYSADSRHTRRSINLYPPSVARWQSLPKISILI